MIPFLTRRRIQSLALLLLLPPVFAALAHGAEAHNPIRLLIETDAGGDPDDEQSLVRFLLYVNEWDVEGIIANRAQARAGENKNPERTGIGILRRLIQAYGECAASLREHDPRFPTAEHLLARTVAGYNETEAAVNLIIAAVDKPDPRPLWYSDWGTDHGGATNNLHRALDRVLRERGREGYAKFKSRLRLASADAFGDHTAKVEPAFPLWIDTFRPELERRRWYHRFSALTARAGGFDLERDVRTGHGPLGAMYPTNTTHWQKEGDTMTLLYLVPNGLSEPEEPAWGSWAGRYGLNENYPGKLYYWANASDHWQGSAHRENSLRRWAVHLQNDFKARLDWCVKDFPDANHPPRPKLDGDSKRVARPGETIVLDASASTDPDGDAMAFEWIFYPEPSGYAGPLPVIENAHSDRVTIVLPASNAAETLHFVLILTDRGDPPLTRYQRVIVSLQPR